MTDVFTQLSAPFPADRVSWRVGSTTADKTRGMALAYIDARDVMDRLDAVCGPGAWQCRYPHANGKTVCEVGIKVGDEWIWKSDGAGDTDYEAEKGALSDAFKRAAVRWGIGRYLYDLDSPWVEVEVRGKTAVIKKEEYGKLRALLERRPANAPPPPAPVAQRVRKSSAQAKKDGDDAKIKAEIATLDREGVKDWHLNFDRYTAELPTGWLDSIHNMLELRLEELNGAASVASEASDMDAAFRGAVGSAGAGTVAGRNGHRAGAPA